MVEKIRNIAAGALLIAGIVSCGAANKVTGKVVKPSQKRTVETQNLLKNLQNIPAKGFMFGHQDDTAYGIGWDGDSDRSDVKSVCGDYPAVCGWDLGHIELGDDKNLDKIPFDRIRKDIVAQYLRGGLNTVSWHLNNPLTGGDAWDVKTDGVVKSILPGGSKHELFLSWLNKLTVFFKSLKTADGKSIPVLFRPWHEHTGSWFWWGKSHCTPQEYKDLWKMTHDYLTSHGVTNLLYAYSPGSEKTVDEYMERYPGDSYVDLLGFDCYPSVKPEGTEEYKTLMNTVLTYLTKLGKEHHKVIAVTETGLEALPIANWWMDVLFPVIDKYPISYVLVWRNAHDKQNHFYAPYPGQASAPNFVEFYNQPKTFFCKDVKNLYK
ncbi:glycosyl hydrolase [uncultured Bacteroides sp.]|uniref:glycoside hydrolase family 26 protein n=1 Tax=uncultured Bacteroides sp. TaxID=162156 RepID=UPI002AAAD6ED|nr:glycosyl hydrolase [uncultured Bacteroides sp.]